MADPFIYRALFPPHFTPRTGTTQDRRWHTLKPPVVRVMGALWSFGLRLRNSGAAGLPGTPDASTDRVAVALRALYETAKTEALGPLAAYAGPVLMRAEVESFLQPDPHDLSASRLSLLAVDTIAAGNTGNKTILKPKRSELGFLDGHRPLEPEPIILAPFGGQPTPGESTSYLPAMQLVHGRIRYDADPDYMGNLRTRLGIEAPGSIATSPGGEVDLPANRIVLLPDGFCLTGALHLPWLEGRHAVSGWFKATHQQFPSNGTVLRGLTPWIDPDGDAAVAGRWQEWTDEFEHILRRVDGDPSGPKWCRLSPNGRVLAQHLFWLEKKKDPGPLLTAVDGNAVVIDSPGIDVRISVGREGIDDSSSVTIQPESLVVEGSVDELTITVTAGSPTAAGGVGASYSFERGATPQESLSVGQGSTHDAPIELAIPLIETADLVRRASGLPAPQPLRRKAEEEGQPPPTGDPNQLGLLWTFTPVTGGWMHWPLPNATAANLASLLVHAGATEAAAETGDVAAVAPAAAPARAEISGAIGFSGRPGRPGSPSDERAWGFSVGSLVGARATIIIGTPTGSTARVESASVALSGGAAAFDGLMVVTPFAQTPERLLPDHDERALTSVGLRAVSPSLLRGVEESMWIQSAQAKKEAAAVRLAARLSDFVLTPAETTDARPVVSPDARVEVEFTFAGRAADGPIRSAMRPWFWLRHGTLPTVQTLPLAVAGSERTQPFGSRALAPLQVETPPTNGRLKFSAPFTVTSTAMAISVEVDSGPFGFGAARLVRPKNDDGRWRAEAAMAVTTLPSVSYVVDASSAVVVGCPSGWDAIAAGTPRFRYDLALRDARYAFSRVPPVPPEESDKPTASVDEDRFAPLPGNGPIAEPSPSRPGETKTNGWDRVWRSLDRQAALAALDGREMFASSASGHRLVGVFGDVSYELTGAPVVVSRASQSGDGRLGAIGCYAFTIKAPGIGTAAPAAAATPPITVLGLPSESDLIGLAGQYPRDGASVTLRFGVADLSAVLPTGVTDPAFGDFVDQHGLSAPAHERKGQCLVRTFEDRVNGRTVRSATLTSPLKVVNAAMAEFACVDVPVSGPTKAEKWLRRFTVDAAGIDRNLSRANAAGRAWNHLAGFRWSFGDPAGRDGPVLVDGLAFEPLELWDFTLSEDGSIATIELRGRLRVPLSTAAESSGPVRAPAALGTVRMILTPGGEHLRARLVADSAVTFFLADPDTFGGFAPRLRLEALPEIGKSTSGTVAFEMNGEIRTVTVTAIRNVDGIGVGVKSKPGAVTGSAGSLAFRRFRAKIPAASREKGFLVGSTSAEAVLTYAASFGPEGALFKAYIEHDLLARRTAVKKACHRFSKSNHATLDVTDVVLDHGVLMLCWRAEAGGTLLGGLGLGDARGAITATLAPSSPLTDWPSFTTTDLRLRAAFDLIAPKGEGLRLLLDDLGPPPEGEARRFAYRIHGRLTLENRLSWPKIAPVDAGGDWMTADFPGAPDKPDKPAKNAFTHAVVLAFDGQRIDPQHLAAQDAATARPLPLMVEARHTIELEGATMMEWTVHQVIWLSSARAFAEHLRDRALAALPTKDADAVASGFLGQTDKAPPLSTLALRSHVFAAAAVDHGGLSGPLAATLASEIERVAALAVEFSNHVLLAFRPTVSGPRLAKLTAPPFLLGLPGFDLVATGQDTGFAPSDTLAKMLAARPAASKTTRLWLSRTDGYAAHRLPPIDPSIARRAVEAAQVAADRVDRRLADRASRVTAFDPGSAHRAVFQPLLFEAGADGTPVVPVADLPTAGVAFLLSALADDAVNGAKGDQTPLAIGFAGSHRIEARDFFLGLADATEADLAEPTVFRPSVYARALALFQETVSRHLVPGPTADRPVVANADPEAVVVEIEAPSLDGTGLSIVSGDRVKPNTAADLATLKRGAPGWALRVLRAHAPWSRSGLLLIRSGDFGLPAGSVGLVRAVGVDVDHPAAPADASPGSPEPVAQPQRESVRASAADERLARGYAPLRARPLMLASESALAGDGSTEGPRLTATGLEVSWALAGGSHALLGGGSPGAPTSIWLADRETIAFRPSVAPPEKGAYDLTFAIPADHDQPTPAGLMPTAHTEGRPVAETGTANAPAIAVEQSFAPAFSAVARVSPRVGAWAAMRFGLASSATDAAGPVRIRASERPVHARTPRPPLLAYNDRTRASSHEQTHCVVGRDPSVIVHGPRFGRVGADDLPPGLDRSPRSRWATRIRLVEPQGGILRSNWNGTIVVEATDHFGASADANASWTVEAAVLIVNAVRYAAEATSLGTIAWASHRDGAVAAVRGLPPATRAELELTLACDVPAEPGGTAFRLRRPVRFPLLTGGSPQGEIEAPVFVRFEDPEFNDRLTGLAVVDRRSSPLVPLDDLALAADASKVVVGGRIEVVLAALPKQAGDAVTPFSSDTGRLAYPSGPAAKRLRLIVERQRPGTREAVRLGAGDAAIPPIVGAVYVTAQGDETLPAFEFDGSDPRSVVAFTIDSGRLAIVDGTAGAPLLPGDTLVIRIALADPQSPILCSLRFDMRGEPELAPNSSSFALLALEPADPSPAVHADLYADNPPPTWIEIVDPRDLLDGIVRRRAIYLWRVFAPTASGKVRRYAVQKINAVGGTWVADDLRTEWQAASGC